jgi:UDP-N-acetylmuramoylalanine--D-glutamate ligase
MFGTDMLNDESLIPTLNELIGIAETKPFECVGTTWEVRYALEEASKIYGNSKLLDYYKTLNLNYSIPEYEDGDNVPAIYKSLVEDKKYWKDIDLDKFRNKKIVILGFGKEGRSSYKFLTKYLNKDNIYVMDQNPLLVDELGKILVPYMENLNEYDYIFKTPGLPGFLLKEIDQNKIYSQTRLFLELRGNKTIGVTGTKGKSTTSSLINYALNKMGKKSILVGNIGTPSLDALELDTDYYVYELSAFQLEFISVGPFISVLLNFFEEHLNNYDSYESYKRAKLNVFKGSKHKMYCCDNDEVVNYMGSGLMSFGHIENKKTDGYFIDNDKIVGTHIFDKNFKRNLLGEHNLVNSLCVFNIFDILGLDSLKLPDLIGSFKGLEHRIEYVGKFNNIEFYNDSISTIPEACIKAVAAVNPDTVIIGGFDRKIHYEDFIDYLNKSDLNVVCLPDTGHNIYEKLIKNKYKVNDMEEAVNVSKKIGHRILLSPAASSYNMYKNFEERGTHFKELAKRD